MLMRSLAVCAIILAPVGLLLITIYRLSMHAYFARFVFPVKVAKAWPTVTIQTDQDTVWGQQERKEIAPWCEANGVTMRFAGVAQPHQIGLVERSWSTAANIMRKLLLQHRLPATYWPAAAFEAVRMMNIVYTVRDTGQGAYELRFGLLPTRKLV